MTVGMVARVDLGGRALVLGLSAVCLVAMSGMAVHIFTGKGEAAVWARGNPPGSLPEKDRKTLAAYRTHVTVLVIFAALGSMTVGLAALYTAGLLAKVAIMGAGSLALATPAKFGAAGLGAFAIASLVYMYLRSRANPPQHSEDLDTAAPPTTAEAK